MTNDHVDVTSRDTDEAPKPIRPVPAVHASAHWYSLAEAAVLLGISETALRKEIAARRMTALRLGRSWRVLLPGEPRTPAESKHVTPPKGKLETHSGDGNESLVNLIHDLQRQSLALAAQVGYLQQQLTQAHEQIATLTLQREATLPDASETRADQHHEELIHQVDELQARVRAAENAQKKGRKWRFWRR